GEPGGGAGRVGGEASRGPDDRGGVEPAAQEDRDGAHAPEPTAHGLPKDFAEVLGVLVVGGVPDFTARIDIEVASRPDAADVDGQEVAGRQSQDPTIEGLFAIDEAAAQILTTTPSFGCGPKGRTSSSWRSSEPHTKFRS